MKYLILLPLLLLAACEPVASLPVNPEIESPLQNTCQSGDLDPVAPKCELVER